MARNAIESEFWTSKMAAGSHFVNKITNIKIMILIWNGKWYLEVEGVIWPMFEPTAGRIQLDINSLLVNIYTDRYVGNEGIYIVFAL